MTELANLTDKVEQVSALYAQRCNIRRDDDWFALKLQEEAGELIAEHLRLTGRGRVRSGTLHEGRQKLGDEAADLFAQVLLFCRHNGIDLEAALQRKWFSHLDAVEPGGTRT